MNESSYLTFDLDFYLKSKVDRAFLHRLLKRVPKENRAAAINHDSILPHIRRQARTLKRVVNLDYHSDLGGCLDITFETARTGLRRLELHSGSWADYVELDDKQEFAWGYPHPDCRVLGRTDYFSINRPFHLINQVGRNPWRKLTQFWAKPPNYGISLRNIEGVSVVLSPGFCGDDAYEVFLSLVRDHELEPLDFLPEDLQVDRLRALRERARKQDESYKENAGRSTEGRRIAPRASLRIWGFRCKTMRQRRAATKEAYRVLVTPHIERDQQKLLAPPDKAKPQITPTPLKVTETQNDTHDQR
jgi:hypothetical protein